MPPLSKSNQLYLTMMQLTATHTDSNNDDVELTDSTGIDAIDNASESNEVDNELTFTDTISDDTTQADPMPDVTDSRAVSPSANNDVYSFIKQRLLSLDPLTTMALGRLSYHDNFYPHYFPPEKEGSFRKTLYKISKDDDADELGLVFFGEICPSAYGTAISAKGNHYAGSAENPKVRTISIFQLPVSL